MDTYVLDTCFIINIENCFPNTKNRKLIFDYLTTDKNKKAYALHSEIEKSKNDRSWLEPYIENIATSDEKTVEFLALLPKTDNEFIRRQIVPNNLNDMKLIHFAHEKKAVRTIVSDDLSVLCVAEYLSIKRCCFKEIIRKINKVYGTQFNDPEFDCLFMFYLEEGEASHFWQHYSNTKKCHLCSPRKECQSYSNPPKIEETQPVTS